MKILIILLLIFSNQNLMSVETEKMAPIKESDKVQSGLVINGTLKKLLDIKGVDAIYKTCLSEKKNQTEDQNEDQSNLPDCIWRKMDPKLKKTVQETYAAEIKKIANGRSPASAGELNLTAKQDVVADNYGTDPAVIALSNFYKTKLDAVLNPQIALSAEDQKNGAILNTDHRQYVDLYKSELGKTIINAFTSFCLDTDPATCSCEDFDEQACATDKTKCGCTRNSCEINNAKEHRQKNIDSLANLDLNSKSKAAMKWNMCIASVTKSCTDKTISSTSETKKRSCIIMDYVESARKNIMYADDQKKFYDELGKDRTTNIVSNTKGITDKKKNSSEALLEITSADIEKALKDPMVKTEKEFEECYKENAEGQGQIVNTEACKKYLNTNTDENNAAVVEMGIRYNAHQEIIETELKDDAKVKSYLKEEGYSDDQITALTKDASNIEKVRAEIIERYKSKKEAIIAEMTAKIEKKTSTTDGKIDPASAPDLDKLKKIKADLNSRTTDLQNLVKFNNIVSAYMEVNSNGKTERNTASLHAEVNSMKEEDAKKLNEQIKKNKLGDQRGTSNTVDFEVDKINKVLKYAVEDEMENAAKKKNGN